MQVWAKMLYQQNQPWHAISEWRSASLAPSLLPPPNESKQLDQSSSSAKEVWGQTTRRLCLQSCCSMTSSCSQPSHQSQQKAKGRRKGCRDKLPVHKLFQEVQQNLICFGFHHVPRFCEMLEKLWHWATFKEQSHIAGPETPKEAQ